MAVLLRSSKIDNGAVKYSVTLAHQRYSHKLVFAIVPKSRAKTQKGRRDPPVRRLRSSI